MYKNQLQELAQRSCFNLPSYTCIREGPDHAPRFKVTVNFNGEMFESPHHCPTIRRAEHSAAEVALNSLSTTGPSRSLAARILDGTGVYKNLLQDISQRLGAPLPQYTTYRSGPRHQPVFTGTVELAGITFTGEAANNKKRAEKNAALAAWSSLKQLAASFSSEAEISGELEQFTIARILLKYSVNGKLVLNNDSGPVQFNKNFRVPNQRPSSPQPPPSTTSKILPLICQRTPRPRNRPAMPKGRRSLAKRNDYSMQSTRASVMESSGGHRGSIPQPSVTESWRMRPTSKAQASTIESWPQRFPAAGADPYTRRPYRGTCHGIAPPVRARNAVPVLSAPPFPPPNRLPAHVTQGSAVRIGPPTYNRQPVPFCAGPPVRKDTPVNAKYVHVSQKEPENARRASFF